jgi:two-component system, OmpR family, sensor histidine kinase QseC
MKILINEVETDLLIANLLSNALNHNISDVYIKIEMNENELKICNSGETNNFNNENIFKRFVKGNSKSYGLGLAIAKNICETNQIEIKYLKNILHCFVLKQKFCENSVS